MEVSYSYHVKAYIQRPALGSPHLWQAFPQGKKSPTRKCFLPSGSEMALEKINTLLPPDVLHVIVSLC